MRFLRRLIIEASKVDLYKHNHVVCHGIPDDEKYSKRGDIINIDITVIKAGYHGDTSKMFKVGEVNHLQRLIRITQECIKELSS